MGCFIYKNIPSIGIVSTFKEKMKNGLFITTSAKPIIWYIIPKNIAF